MELSEGIIFVWGTLCQYDVHNPSGAMSCRSSHVIKLKLSSQRVGLKRGMGNEEMGNGNEEMEMWKYRSSIISSHAME